MRMPIEGQWPVGLGGATYLRTDEIEGAVGIGAEGGDRRDAHHDNQGEHHRVLHRRGTFLVPHKHPQREGSTDLMEDSFGC